MGSIFSRLFYISSSSSSVITTTTSETALSSAMVLPSTGPSHCSGGPVSTDDCDIFNWRGLIFGPDGTPFEGGVFFLSIRVREDHPFKPPSIKFLTKIFHPNVDKFGNIHLDILREQWSPALTLPKVLLSICSFLDDPNVDEAANRTAKIYRDDRQKYDKIARAWTRKYAMG